MFEELWLVMLVEQVVSVTEGSSNPDCVSSVSL